MHEVLGKTELLPAGVTPARVAARPPRPPTMVGAAMALLGNMAATTMAPTRAMVGAEAPTLPASVFIL